MAEPIAATRGAFHIRSEARGPHWIAWIARSADGDPEDGVVLVAATQAEAEARARQWADRRV